MPQGATSGLAPRVEKVQADVEPVATAGNTLETNIGEVPGNPGETWTVTSVTYTPNAAITGVNTNTRLLELRNRRQDGTGNVLVASLQFNAGVNAAADDETTITLTGVAADKVVNPGDILAWRSVAVGTGITDPGGLAQAELDRD